MPTNWSLGWPQHGACERPTCPGSGLTGAETVDINLDRIAAAGVPTLVLCGGWDAGFRAVATHLTTALSGRLVEFPDADHFFFANAPDIGREVEQWWRQHKTA